MEIENKRKLPSIFKMSLLCCILPYYGHLHRWRRLLETLSSKTREIWNQNKDALIYWGKDFKSNIEINYKNYQDIENKIQSSKRSWLDLFSLSLFSNAIWKRIDFSIFISNLEENEAVIFNPHNDLFKDYQIIYWKKDKIPDILPAVLCPSFKSEVKKFNGSELNRLRHFFINDPYIKSVVVERNQDEVSVYTVMSQTLKLKFNKFNYNYWDLKSYYKHTNQNQIWEVSDWVCKPKRLRIWEYSKKNLTKRINEINEISYIEDIQIWFNDNYNEKLCSDNFLRTYGNISVYKILFNHKPDSLDEDYTELVFSGKLITLIIDGKTFTYELAKFRENLFGSKLLWDKKNEIENGNIIAFKVDATASFVIDIKENKDANLDMVKFINSDLMKLIDSEIVKHNSSSIFNVAINDDLYVVFDKNDLTLVTTLEEFNNKADKIYYWNKADLIVKDKLESDCIVQMLECIPEHLVCRLEVNDSDQLLAYMKCQQLIDKMKETGITFLFNEIEIQPRKILNEQEEKDVIDKILMMENKRTINMSKEQELNDIEDLEEHFLKIKEENKESF